MSDDGDGVLAIVGGVILGLLGAVLIAELTAPKCPHCNARVQKGVPVCPTCRTYLTWR